MKNEKESIGLRDLLESINDKIVVFNLVTTVTQNMIKADTNDFKGAVEIIIQHSQNAESVLRRKTITVPILYKYLHDKNVSIFPPVTKPNLIDKIIHYWNFSDSEGAQQPMKQILPAPQIENSNNDLEYNQNMRLYEHKQNESTTVSTNKEFPINKLALEFTEWFYRMYNTPNGLSTAHLWQDCSLCLNIISDDTQIESLTSNIPQDIVRTLEDTKTKYLLYFNPNLCHEGVQGRFDPHGLAMILACGTLHSNNSCIGVFEHVFMIAQDPYSDNNWKIKKTQLNIRSKSVTGLPKLCEGELTSNLMVSTSDAVNL